MMTELAALTERVARLELTLYAKIKTRRDYMKAWQLAARNKPGYAEKEKARQAARYAKHKLDPKWVELHRMRSRIYHERKRAGL